MPRKAKIYIAGVAGIGLMLLAGACWRWESHDLTRYSTYLVLAVLAATLKIRLPRLTGTVTPSFLFVLIGIVDLTWPETATIGCASVLAQCLWSAKVRPKLVQVLFNIATLAISSGVAYGVCGLVRAGKHSLVAPFAVAGCLLFLTNTLLVSIVLCLLENKPASAVWEYFRFWSFPYYVAGSAVAGLMTVSSRSDGWPASLWVLPVMFLFYSYYQRYILNVSSEPATAVAERLPVGRESELQTRAAPAR